MTIEAANCTKTQPQGGATNQELYNRLKQWAVEHPDTQESALARVFREESKIDGLQHSLLFTDPYESLEQPIEKAWAHTKNYVADVYDRKNPFSMLHHLVQCTAMRVPQDSFSIHTDCPNFPILFSLPSSFRTNSPRRTVFLVVCLEVSDVQ